MTYVEGDTGHVAAHNDVESRLTAVEDQSGSLRRSGVVLDDGSAGTPSVRNADDTDTGLFFPAADTVAVSTGGTEKVRIDSNGLITGTGTSLGAWTAYTPTLNGTGWAIGDGTATGRYCRIGKTVHFVARVEFGSTSTAGATSPFISAPVACADGAFPPNVQLVLTDSSTGTNYVGGAYWQTTSTLAVVSLGDYSVWLGIGANAPFTWAAGDDIYLTGTYEAA